MSEVNAGRAAIRRARVISNEFVQSNECEPPNEDDMPNMTDDDIANLKKLAGVSDEELVAEFARAHLECPCDESGEEWAKYPPDCCNAAGARAVRAKLGAAEVTEVAVSLVLEVFAQRRLDAILRATAAKGG